MAAMRTPDHDILGLIGDLIRFGKVVSVDGARAVVKTGDITSPPLPWISLTGLFGIWVAPSIDQQVVIICPEADIDAGFILGGLFSNDFPAPDSGALKFTVKMADGSILSYDAESHVLNVQMTEGAVTLNAPVVTSDSSAADFAGNLSSGSGATGSFTTPGGLTVTVSGGIITNIF